VGLFFTWVVVFTLFPVLQRILRTPTLQQRKIAGHWFHGFTERLPAFSYRWRWLLVLSSLLLCVIGAVAIFGLPGLLGPMRIATNGIEYINHDSTLYRDTKRLEQVISGLSITEVWLKGQVGSLTEPEVLRGLDRFQEALRHEKTIGAVAGPTTILRMMRYLGGSGDRFPEDPGELAKMGADLEQLLPSQPMLQRFIEPAGLSQTHVAVISRSVDYEGFQALDGLIRQRWKEAVLAVPALAAFEVRIVGTAPLEAKISYHLVPTLVESFGLTVVIIFGAFLLVFRNGPARIMAMIPSLFAILVMFAVMRVTGMSLNVATILIASTVLGASENDQIHFFYHFLEKRRTGSAEESLLHTLRIAGRAIFFATLINAGGFLAFAFADLPPMRQFGVLSALAFLLSMVADFTALPAALWMVFRERPDAHKREGPP
jgi:predicted RND superfamily exporter protein